ncbi:MAG: polyprenol monophosphomannose synthase [Chloroflexota bacterium]
MAIARGGARREKAFAFWLACGHGISRLDPSQGLQYNHGIVEKRASKLTVVLPTYNEAENLPRMVDTLLNLGIDGLSMIVVDDNSPDGTGRVADDLVARYPDRLGVIHRPGKLGLGSAYIAGFKRALAEGADFIVEMDADFSHPPGTLFKFLDIIHDYDVVVGSRYAPGGKLDDRWGRWRRFLSWGGNVYARWITGLRVKDTTAGFKCFRATAMAQIPLDRVRSDGYAFQVEMAYICQRKGFRVCEVPIVFLDRTLGKSKMSGRIIREAAWRVWQMKFRY